MTQEPPKNPQTSDQITERQVFHLTPSAAALLLRIDATTGPRGYDEHELPPKQRGIEWRQLDDLYHKGLISSTTFARCLPLSPEARARLEQLAQKDLRKRRLAAQAATARVVAEDERAGYAEALGLRRTATSSEIVKQIYLLKERVGVSLYGRSR